ncbi:MAG: SRPBCC domain-containing protein [Actinomycetota bacterium]|nr:SRPBCC domain-containing protein [Actinomycetota bacterium]
MTADGRLHTAPDGRATISFERRLSHPPERVWEALTEPGELIGWWGEARVDLREGGSFEVRWLNTDDEGNRAHMHATIARLEPGRLLELEGDIHGTLRWELEPGPGEGTTLRFSSTLELPEEFRTKVVAGWHWHLDALEAVLAGGSADLEELPGWDRIHAEYGG